MRHLYTSRRYGCDEFFSLCAKTWVIALDYITPTVNGYPKGYKRQDNFTTVPRHVTCPKCLDILIDRKTVELNLMKARRAICPP